MRGFSGNNEPSSTQTSTAMQSVLMEFELRLLENLLHQEEGHALDFKQEQYLFDNADTKAKSELLKDILAFANSWRLTTAYILIGVRELKGERSEVIGVERHLDDANLHQFVNAKTQRPVEFSYLPFRTEGVEIGVIQIPIQERPLFLTRQYGGLSKNEVLVRDGSSTRVATPDEIARMGAEKVLADSPQFRLEWADFDNHKPLSLSHNIRSLLLEPALPKHTFRILRPYGFGMDPFANTSFSEKVIACSAERGLLTPLGFRLQNDSGVVGKRIRFTGHVLKKEGRVIQEWIHNVPSRHLSFMSSSLPGLESRSEDLPRQSVRDFGSRWEIIIDFGDVRPREEIWTDSPLFFGSTDPDIIMLEGKLWGDNLTEPIGCRLEVKVDVQRRAMTMNDVLPYLDEG